MSEKDLADGSFGNRASARFLRYAIPTPANVPRIPFIAMNKRAVTEALNRRSAS
jgi:hypothetical protein